MSWDMFVQGIPATLWRRGLRLEASGQALPIQPNGKYTDTGKRYFLPFSALITQVPYPFAIYP
jgi:hypothetical protein